MKKFFNVNTIAGLGFLTAMVVCLQLIANFVKIGPVNITLALIPIVVGACIYGPLAGLFLGVIDGIMIIFAPDTFALFIPQTVFGTILTCVSKTAVAGFLAGLIFKALKNKHPQLGIILASIIVPIVNTGMFVMFCGIFFLPLLEGFATDAGKNTVEYLFLTFIGVNFIVEFLVNAILSPAVFQLYRILNKKN